MPRKRKELNIKGSYLWYFVGLITTDGSLSSDGRHINITSKDSGFLEKLKDSFKLSNKIGVKNKDRVKKAYYIEFSNRNFYEFLLSIGLTPAKSLTQDEVIVPDEFFCDFLRWVVDGDGSIKNWTHPTNKKAQWSLTIYSASPQFIEWLAKSIGLIFRAKGRIHKYEKERPSADMYILKYGKVAAKIILGRCYYKGALSLDRKARLAQACCVSPEGWKRSKTVLN